MSLLTVETKEELMKQRELERLKRYLFIKFGKKSFDMFWTKHSTSFTDYKGIYVKYDVQTNHHRLFSEDELRLLRKTHAIHERGHIQYDVGGVTQQWVQDHVSPNQIDWKNNEKYPADWLNFFSGMMIDVRMEYYVTLGLPEATSLFKFTNEHWRFGIRGIKAGDCKINDFKECIASRGFQLDDLEWHPESIALADEVQDILTELRKSKSTVECMDYSLKMIRTVWPTLYDWLEAEGFKPSIPTNTHDSSSWGNPSEVEKNIEEVLEEVLEEVDPADEESLIRQLKKELAEDEKFIDEEIGDYQARKEDVEIELPSEKKSISESVIVKPYYNQNLNLYNELKNKLRIMINKTSKDLKKILAPEEDILLTNQRSGHLDITQIWSAIKMDNPNIFKSTIKGNNTFTARTFIMNDISGSTRLYFSSGKERIINVMKQALVLLNEVCTQIHLPLEIFAFTEKYSGEDYGTEIYPLKPFNKSTNLEKSFIGGIKAEAGNRDTLALQWIINRAQNYSEELKLIFMISDGLPCFEEGEDIYTIRNMVQVANKKGIDVVCLFIGDPGNFEQVKIMYPGHAILVTSNLQRDLTNQLTKIIAKRKAIF